MRIQEHVAQRQLRQAGADVIVSSTKIGGLLLADAVESRHIVPETLRSRAVTSVPSRVRAASLAAALFVRLIVDWPSRPARTTVNGAKSSFFAIALMTPASIVFTNGIVGAGEWAFEQVKIYSFEGMVAKRLDSYYQRGRSNDWQKIKYARYCRPADLGFGKDKS